MRRALCCLVLALGIACAALAGWFVLAFMHEPSARADEAVDAGAPDAAMPILFWSCSDDMVGGPGCEAVHGERTELGTDDLVWVDPSSLDSVRLAPMKPSPFLSIDVSKDGADLILGWGTDKADHRVSISQLLRDLAKLKREVRELKANQPTPTKGTP